MFDNRISLNPMVEKGQLYDALKFLAIPKVMALLSGLDGKAGSYSAQDLKAIISDDNALQLSGSNPLGMSNGSKNGMLALPTQAKDILLDSNTAQGLRLLANEDAQSGVSVVDVLSNASIEKGLKNADQLRELSADDLSEAMGVIPMNMPVIYTLSDLTRDISYRAKDNAIQLGAIDRKKDREKPVDANSYAFFNLKSPFSVYGRMRQKIAFAPPDLTREKQGLNKEYGSKLDELFGQAYAESNKAAEAWMKKHEKTLSKSTQTVSEDDVENTNLMGSSSEPPETAMQAADNKTNASKGNASQSNADSVPIKSDNQAIVKSSSLAETGLKASNLVPGQQAKSDSSNQNVLSVNDTLKGAYRAIEMVKYISTNLDDDNNTKPDSSQPTDASKDATQGSDATKSQSDNSDAKTTLSTQPTQTKNQLKGAYREAALGRCVALLDQAQLSLGGLNGVKGLDELITPLKTAVTDLSKKLKPAHAKLAQKNPVFVQSRERLKKAADAKDTLKTKWINKYKDVDIEESSFNLFKKAYDPAADPMESFEARGALEVLQDSGLMNNSLLKAHSLTNSLAVNPGYKTDETTDKTVKSEQKSNAN